MKSVVVFYSFSGKTGAVAKKAAQELQCEAVELEEVKKRSVLGAYVLGAFAAMRGKASEIKPISLDMDSYDTIFIATPVWASSPAPAINAFLEKTSFKGKRVVLLICPASGDDSKTAAKLTEKVQSKGGTVLQHHAFKTSGTSEQELIKQARDTVKIYK